MRGNLIKRIRNKYQNSYLRTKLLIVFSMLFFLTTLIVMVVLYTFVLKNNKKQILFSANQSFIQAHSVLEKKVSNLVYTSDIINFNSTIQEILWQKWDQMDYLQQYHNMLTLEDTLQHASNSEDVFQASLFVDDHLFYASQNVYFFPESSLTEYSGYRSWIDSDEVRMWLPPKKEYNPGIGKEIELISMLRKIKSSDGNNILIGTARVSTTAKEIDDIIGKAVNTQKEQVYVINSQGELISADKNTLDQKLPLSPMSVKDFKNWTRTSIDGESYLVCAQRIKNTDWTLVARIPYSEFLVLSNQLGGVFLILMISITAISFVIIYFISHSFTKRLCILSSEMEKVEKGDLDSGVVSESKDEVGNLINNFQYMTTKIKEMTREHYENGKAIKNAELKTLQAQINPHFLYNVLDLISWMAYDNDVPQIAEVSMNLAKFYKLSLNKGKDVVTIADELSHVTAYVKIQNYRFDGKLNLDIDVNDDIKNCAILKNLLQPLVENAILHGLMARRDENVKLIQIHAVISENVISILIQDNGAGMSQEQLAGIMVKQPAKSQGGFGVMNIQKRIKLCYGEDFGLSFESESGVGTAVTVKIPVNLFEETT